MPKLFLKYSEYELLSFFRQLGHLMESGIAISKALSILEKKYQKLNILNISQKLSEGKTLSCSINDFKLSPSLSNLIEIGEKTGKLSGALIKVSGIIEKNLNFRKNLINSLIYPACVLLLSFFSLVGMVFFILPAFGELFSANNFELPFITKAIISLPQYSIILLMAAALGLFGVYKIVRFPKARHSVPILGDLHKKMQAMDFSKALGEQLMASVPCVSAIDSSAASLDPIYKDAVQKIKTSVENGMSLSEAIFAFPALFPETVTKMASVGEESGSLGSMLSNAADILEGEIQDKTKSLLVFIEPVATLMVGLVVAILALGVMLPLFSMVNSLL